MEVIQDISDIWHADWFLADIMLTICYNSRVSWINISDIFFKIFNIGDNYMINKSECINNCLGLYNVFVLNIIYILSFIIQLKKISEK